MLPKGSILCCSSCGEELYKTKFNIENGDFLSPYKFEPIGKQEKAKNDELISCSYCDSGVNIKEPLNYIYN